MPYYPDGRQYKVYVRDFLVYPKNGDFDTLALLYIKTPDGEKIPVNKFYHEKNREMVEITEDDVAWCAYIMSWLTYNKPEYVILP